MTFSDFILYMFFHVYKQTKFLTKAAIHRCFRELVSLKYLAKFQGKQF